MENKIQYLIQYLAENHPDFMATPMKPEKLIFEEGIKMSCYYCGRYNNNWRCPPNIPNLDYKKMMQEYKDGLFVWVNCPYNETNYQEIRSESSAILHRVLLELEKVLWNKDSAMYLSFIGGSCKLCKNGCGKERCNNPYLSRTPLEALGVNLIKSTKEYGINISFPPNGVLMRIGLIIWQ